MIGMPSPVLSKKHLFVLALTVALSTVVGCSASSARAASGPLDGPDWEKAGSAQMCMPAKQGATLTFGGDELHNYGHKDVVVDKVALLEPKGLRLVDAVVLPTRNNFVGYDNHYPPRKSFLDGLESAWDSRRPAVGMTIAPQPDTTSDTARTHNLVVAVRVTGSTKVRMTGVIVDYHVGGKQYRWHNITSLVVQTKKAAC
ncbi:hypothetical protein [Streptomyces sp. GbtcB6]|uniref:hypothetical protein n=1 Tax=Streptomyces sp. GbtcB6 TaxID=2824751 RepID=UPI001C2FB1A6|nr:hypothetical protein [Streptomyces sp. GbtcB6]